MRIFITIIVLIFSLQSWTKADDIRDFEIEGMSIGDSALDYVTEEEINNGVHAKEFTDDAYTQTTLYLSTLETYQAISISYKTRDKKYIIEGLGGALSCKDMIQKCYKKQDEIFNELKKMFPNAKSYGPKKKDLSWSKNGSTTNQSHTEFSDGSIAGVQSFHFSKKDRDKKNINHFLRVNLFSNEFNYWLLNVAYK